MQIIDGKSVSTQIRLKIKDEIARVVSSYIGLAVILVGDDPASQIYVHNKIKACEEVGIKSYLYTMPKDSSYSDVLAKIEYLNHSNDVTGILLQLPLPDHLDSVSLLDAIDPNKDVDGCHYVQKGKLWVGRPSITACTPKGCLALLKRYDIPIEGKNVVVVGRSNLVGRPLAQLLLSENATVTICHSKTENLGEITKNADILCVAVGKAKLITADMVKDGAVVIDVGMNRDENGKLCGDVDYPNVSKKCSYITPVPGGVGPMTVTMLMQNALELYKIQNGIE